MPELFNTAANNLLLPPLRKSIETALTDNSLYLTGRQKREFLHRFNDNQQDAAYLLDLKKEVYAAIDAAKKLDHPDLSDTKTLAIDAAETAEFYNDNDY